jgi:hypothetical protein
LSTSTLFYHRCEPLEQMEVKICGLKTKMITHIFFFKIMLRKAIDISVNYWFFQKLREFIVVAQKLVNLIYTSSSEDIGL